ncbi:MAG TPA: TolC family protein, partial [Candidatus Binataceae bacterium]|nr:TolC family protein [Candidatus Binataceae bacterium]
MASVGIFATVCICGCSDFGNRPELAPDTWAPPRSNRQWTNSPEISRDAALSDMTIQPALAAPGVIQTGQEYDLPKLIDIALLNNPGTRRAWGTARAAAANYGSAQAPYYPQASFNSDSGFERTIIELPTTPGTLKQWQSDPYFTMNWTLLDFGRRESGSESARERLIAANLSFNRTIQTVVFDTEAAFYALDAADGAVAAAGQNLKLAETDFDAVHQRVNLGLATQPELLLSKERVAQSRYDLANAQLMVHDGQAQLAVAMGVPADPPVKIVGLETQAPPHELSHSVEELIAQARRQ